MYNHHNVQYKITDIHFFGNLLLVPGFVSGQLKYSIIKCRMSETVYPVKKKCIDIFHVVFITNMYMKKIVSMSA